MHHSKIMLFACLHSVEENSGQSREAVSVFLVQLHVESPSDHAEHTWAPYSMLISWKTTWQIYGSNYRYLHLNPLEERKMQC